MFYSSMNNRRVFVSFDERKPGQYCILMVSVTTGFSFESTGNANKPTILFETNITSESM